MPLQLEAVYENGILRLDQPLPLREHERVTIRIERRSSAVDATYGIMGWTGPAEALRRLAEDDEYGLQEAP